MTAAQFCSDFAAKEPVFPSIATARDWLVRFRYSLRGEAPKIAQETVKGATSEATAIREAIVQRLGGVNRPLHEIEMIEVRCVA